MRMLNRIEIKIEDYIKSLKEIKKIGKADRDDELTKAELKGSEHMLPILPISKGFKIAT